MPWPEPVMMATWPCRTPGGCLSASRRWQIKVLHGLVCGQTMCSFGSNQRLGSLAESDVIITCSQGGWIVVARTLTACGGLCGELCAGGGRCDVSEELVRALHGNHGATQSASLDLHPSRRRDRSATRGRLCPPPRGALGEDEGEQPQPAAHRPR